MFYRQKIDLMQVQAHSKGQRRPGPATIVLHRMWRRSVDQNRSQVWLCFGEDSLIGTLVATNEGKGNFWEW